MTHDIFHGRSVATARDPECPPGREVLTLYCTLDELAAINRAINASSGDKGSFPVEATVAQACIRYARDIELSRERGKCGRIGGG